jgi:hypothetical protein
MLGAPTRSHRALEHIDLGRNTKRQPSQETQGRNEDNRGAPLCQHRPLPPSSALCRPLLLLLAPHWAGSTGTGAGMRPKAI